MNRFELEAMQVGYGEALRRVQKEIRHLADIKVQCRTCDHFPSGLCQLATPPMKPPPEVLERGCLNWKFDDIPF